MRISPTHQVSRCIHNKPSGFNDISESTRQVCIRHKQPSVSLHSKHDHTGVTNRLVPPGQPNYRSTKGPVSHHVARPQSTNNSLAQRPNPDNRANDTRSSVYILHYRPRPRCSSANSVLVRTPTGHTRREYHSVVAFGNAATITVPTSSSQLQLSFQTNVSTVH